MDSSGDSFDIENGDLDSGLESGLDDTCLSGDLEGGIESGVDSFVRHEMEANLLNQNNLGYQNDYHIDPVKGQDINEELKGDYSMDEVRDAIKGQDVNEELKSDDPMNQVTNAINEIKGVDNGDNSSTGVDEEAAVRRYQETRNNKETRPKHLRNKV